MLYPRKYLSGMKAKKKKDIPKRWKKKQNCIDEHMHVFGFD